MLERLRKRRLWRLACVLMRQAGQNRWKVDAVAGADLMFALLPPVPEQRTP